MEENRNKQQRLVIDGNAFYEIDLECVEKRKGQKEKREQGKTKKERQGR